MNMQFRYDINALRAIAVSGVLLFHFMPDRLPGGFTGVDVFFVISGYLMTAIIVNGLKQNHFSLITFYSARANRLIPALAALCLFLLIFGYFFTLPDDYRTLAKHIGGSIGFISNIMYWQEVGYFDLVAREKWLLHTWSLSAEWQFYLIYPICLMLAYRLFGYKRLKYIVLIAAVGGFVFGALASYQWPKASYYLLPTRAWEMMAGGLVYLYPFRLPEKNSKYLHIVGLAGIGISFLYLKEQSVWPGFWAAVPVLSTAIIIWSNQNYRLLNHSWLQKVGIWSYSIYLWHWPIVAAIYYYSLPYEIACYIGLPLSVLLGFISYRFIETIPFKKISQLKSPLLYWPAYMVLLVGFSASYIFLNDGIRRHSLAESQSVWAVAQSKNPYKCMEKWEKNKEPCFIGNINNIKAIIVGDSHAESITTALADALDKKREGIIALNKSGCLLIKDVKFTDPKRTCAEENIERLKFLNTQYPDVPVFLVSRTSSYLLGNNNLAGMPHQPPLIYFSKQFDEKNNILMQEFTHKMHQTVCEIRKNHPVFLIMPIPEMRHHIPNKIAKANLIPFGQSEHSQSSRAFYMQRNGQIRNIFTNVAHQCQAKTLDPTQYLCNATECMATYQNIPIYFDDDHLNEHGNRLLIPMFKQALLPNP